MCRRRLGSRRGLGTLRDPDGFPLEYMALAAACPVTAQITFLAGPLALMVAFAAGIARLSELRAVRWPTACFVEVFRGTSALVQLFFLFFVLPLLGVELSPLATGVLALGLNIGSYGSEVVRGAILSVPRGQVEAAVALNMSPWRRMRSVVLPRRARDATALWNLAIDLLKSTALVSLITLPDLTFEAQILRTATADTLTIFTLVLAMYFAMAYGDYALREGARAPHLEG